MSQNREVLIVDKMHESIVPLLSEAGFSPKYAPELTREEIISRLPKAIGLVIRSKTEVNQELINAGTQLQFVARAGAGMDLLDTEYLEKKNVQILNAPEGNRGAVGEHTLGLLLSLLHKISVSNQEVKSGVWRREENRGVELSTKVVGIYGFGNAGKAFAKKLAGMECKIVAYDKYKKGFSSELVELEEFREQVEILSIHIPLTNDTRFLFSREELLKYPKLKVVINTARGEVLRLEDVVGMLEERLLWGVGLDVLENEKLQTLSEKEADTFNKLTSFDNVLLTPHVAGWTQESYEKINQVLVQKIKNLELL